MHYAKGLCWLVTDSVLFLHFLLQQAQQISVLKEHIEDEIKQHEKLIKQHQEEIERHKKKIRDLKEH